MRILRLVRDGDFAVEFHPYITVVRDLTDEQRRAVVDAFASAATGRVAVTSGLIEVHGMVLDLDEESLGLLDLPSSPLEQTVRAVDLPGSATEVVGRQVRAVERRLEALEQPRRDDADALRRAEQRLDAASALHVGARAALDGARARLVDHRDGEGTTAPALRPVPDESARPAVSSPPADEVARAELAARRLATLEVRRRALDEHAAVLHRRRAELVAALDPDAADAVEAACAAGADDAGDADAPPGERAAGDDLAALERRLSLLRQDDPEAVRARLDELRQMRRQGEMAQSPRALSLADRLEQLERETSRSVDDDVPGTADIEAADARAENARQVLAEADRASAPADADIDALEEAHAEVERAREAAESKLRRPRSQERLDAALAAEEEILDRLGLASYTEYLLSGGSVGVDRDAGGDTMALRLAVLEAEAEAADLRRAVDDALAHAEMVDELRRTRNEARELLGAPDVADEGLATALINHREPADVSIPEAELARALERVGFPVAGLDLDADELQGLAADWLVNHETAVSSLQAQIEAARGAESGVDPEPIPAPGPDRLEAAQARLAAHSETVAALAAVDTELAEVADRRTSIADEQAAGPMSGGGADHARPDEAPDETGSAPAPEEDVETAEAALADADAAVEVARAEVEAAAAVAAQSASSYDEAVQELAALRRTHEDLDGEPPPVDEIEWYLLARLAALRQISFAGSVPLVIDGALDDVGDDDGLHHLLERLERMAGAVQIVHLTDDPRIVAWGEGLTVERGAIVEPSAPTETVSSG